MVAPRLLLVAAGLSLGVAAPPAHADPICTADAPPPGAARKPVDGGATLWVAADGRVGISTPHGTGSVQVPNAGPLPLRALMVDVQQDGGRQLIVSNGREAHLFVVSGCEITTAVDSEDKPFLFDLENLRGHGTGVGCIDLGDGRRLVGLQALADHDGWMVRRTEINLNGTTATIGRSDLVTVGSGFDPAVTTAQTISCGEQTIDQDGVVQP